MRGSYLVGVAIVLHYITALSRVRESVGRSRDGVEYEGELLWRSSHHTLLHHCTIMSERECSQ